MTFKKEEEEKKPREKHPLIITGINLDELSAKIRPITPCNRKTLLTVGMTIFLNSHTEEEICVLVAGNTFEEKMKRAGLKGEVDIIEDEEKK